MNGIRVFQIRDYGSSFIPGEFIPKGENEYWHRDLRAKRPDKGWRHLKASEIEALVKNGNTCVEWDDFYVSDPFTPELIKNSNFAGLNRLGILDSVALEHHDFQIPTGITNSTVVSCDFGDNCAVHDCSYIAHYIVGDSVILSNNDEIHVSNHAKFGNGIVMDGEAEDVRIWIDVMNELGGRSILPFDGMTTADAYAWATRRDDRDLTEAFKKLTQRHFDTRRGQYGEIGSWSVIRSNGIIKDVRIGPCAYIKGANKLKNLTINSSATEPTQIGEGVELVNGIIGFGSRIFYGCKAVRFVMGNNTNLKYGARLIHSVLGDNSTVSCCELLNNLIFPSHEQHHNNSFLIAGLIMGQSNIAAGATLGSNHNSRANDGELRAGRGFWPGLCVTIKQTSSFVSYVMLAKADYKHELDIKYPFSLVSDNETEGRLEIIPAFWWMYDMYALMRMPAKLASRDKRTTKTQNIEFDFLAPDTVEEIFKARELLEILAGKTALATGTHEPGTDARAYGKSLLEGPESGMQDLTVTDDTAENSKRDAVILKPWKAYRAYGQMLVFYAGKNLIPALEKNPKALLDGKSFLSVRERETRWENLGGQIALSSKVERVLDRIKSQSLCDWNEVHLEWDRIRREYVDDKRLHSAATIRDLAGKERPSPGDITSLLFEFIKITRYVAEETFKSREKDYTNAWRNSVYRSDKERDAVMGPLGENAFIKECRREMEEWAMRAKALVDALPEPERKPVPKEGA